MKKITEIIEQTTGFKADSTSYIYAKHSTLRIRYWFWGLMALILFVLFLPWTQNIRATGNITTLFQDQRPQEINAIIPGRVIKWWVKEGDFVKKGDTIIEMADVKDDYLDPDLLKRTEEQLDAKKEKIDFYNSKIGNTEQQVFALKEMLSLKLSSIENKLEQTKRKLLSDSAELLAAKLDNEIAEQQISRAKQMFSDGIISLVEFERRKVQFNKANALLTEKQQKFLNTKQDLLILKLEMGSLSQETADKVFKAMGEIASSGSDVAEVKDEVAKKKNQLANYRIRGGQRWLIAPQSGQIVKAKKAGLNETVKEGDMIVEIVPDKVDYAAELFLSPMDLILVEKGQQVRLIFDGFPTIVFSGWPKASYGTYLGEVVYVETNKSENGKFRILVVPIKGDQLWPTTLKLGVGAQGFAMLKDVGVWYELWRQINGFPPDYYSRLTESKNKK
jgi:multidrug efflux pump subunit AcrA (membrane-fusion protein)